MSTLLARVETSAEAEQALAAGFDGVVVPASDGFATARSDAVIAVVPPGDDGAGSMSFGAENGATCKLACWRDGVPGPGDLDRVRAEGAGGVLLRPAGRVVDTASMAAISLLAEQCRTMGLTLGLDGGLEPPDVPRLLAIGVDLLVFGAALRSPSGALDPARLALIRDLVPRPAALQRAAPAHDGGPVPPDRIFVRDLILEIAIGAYASERGRLQRVRFTVEADLSGTGRPTRDMRDIVSYDLITDAIGQLTRAGHVEFVETLAEAIAGRVLAHPRVTLVRVRVEKLDLGPGSVGVELVRAKA